MSLQEILQLPPEDRLHIAEQIWDSLNPDDIKLTKEQKEELDARLAVDKAGRMPWYSLDEVKNRLGHK